MKYCDSVFNLNNDAIDSYFNEFPFTLSEFQKWAIHGIVNNRDTMVCAPTGSGKTLVAMEGIYKSLKDGKKVRYAKKSGETLS